MKRLRLCRELVTDCDKSLAFVAPKVAKEVEYLFVRAHQR
jgi:hypothetical protein